MKKIYTFLFACLTFLGIHASSFTISISGTAYSPNSLTVSIGDVVTIQSSAMHPLAQVDGTTWAANGTTTLSTGWGIKTADHTFTITSTNTIFYVCTQHVSFGMKGQIVVSSTGVKENVKALGNISIFPIPATDKMEVNYNLTETALVTVDIVGLNGQHLAALVNEVQAPGKQENTICTPSGLTTGVYYLSISINGVQKEQRLISIK